MSSNTVLLEKKDAVALVTINRPQVYNAMNEEVWAELDKVFEDLEMDDAIRAVVITGAGKAFVAGADIGMINRTDDFNTCRVQSRRFYETLNRIERFPYPVIAAVNGVALGGGCELCLACDFRIASQKAKFGLPEINLGIIPGTGGTQRLPKLIGKSRAKMMILTGDPVSAETALQYGLADDVTEPDQLMDRAMALASKLAAQPRLSVITAKKAVNIACEADLATGLDYESEAFITVTASEDKKKRTAAFLKK